MGYVRAGVLVLGLLLAGQPALAYVEERRGECVVLLHGLFRSAYAMKPLQWFLDNAGYTTVNNSYASISHSIEELAASAVANGAAQCRAQGVNRIHFVTHSLGGILLRQYTSVSPLPGLERVVMLGPPNRGSQVADYVDSLELDLITPQAITQLTTGEQGLPLRLGPVNFELGVIAGTTRQHSVLPGFPDDLSDGTVAVTETIVPGMMDFLQMPTSHTFMIWNPDVFEQVGYFLEHGRFLREEGPQAVPESSPSGR